MELYDVTSTELDNGTNGVPHCVYCIKPYFQHNGKWLPQDFCKIGKSHSVANRSRIYSQNGADVRVLWTIDIDSALYAKRVESALHAFGFEYAAGSDSAHCTELYNMDSDFAYKFLDKFVKVNNLKDNSRILRINKFLETHMSIEEVSGESVCTLINKPHDADAFFNTLFEEKTK